MINLIQHAALRTLWLGLALLATHGSPCGAIAGVEPVPLTAHARADLTDGSRLVGKIIPETLSIRSSIGDLKIPFTSIREIKCPTQQEQALVSLQNGDRISGYLSTTELTIDSILGQLAIPWQQIRRVTITLSGGALLPPGEGPIAFGGANWTAWRVEAEVRDDKLVTLPRARPGFNYGHGGNGRGAMLVTNVGSDDWRDYRIDCEVAATGVDPALNPHGVGNNECGVSLSFHVADMKESWNERGSSAYTFSISPSGAWSLGCAYNGYCNTPGGYGNYSQEGSRQLARGEGITIDRVNGNHLRLEVVGTHIQIWVDDRQVVDLVDAEMPREIGGQTLDHGGVAIQWGYEGMGWIRHFSATRL